MNILVIPRDRKVDSEFQFIRKYQNMVSQDIEKINSCIKGITTNNVDSHMRELYDIKGAVFYVCL